MYMCIYIYIHIIHTIHMLYKHKWDHEQDGGRETERLCLTLGRELAETESMG